MTIGHETRRAARKLELDRRTHATTTQVVFPYDTSGVGELITEELRFGVVYEERPFFAYGLEMGEGEVLVEDDFPFVTCGVVEWVDIQPKGENQGTYYVGAKVWIAVDARTSYRLRFRFSWEGIAYRNSSQIGAAL